MLFLTKKYEKETKNMIRKIKILFATLLLSVLFGVPVLAGYVSFNFSVDLSDDMPDVEYSSNATKTNNNNYATVDYSNSNITSSDDFYFYVVGQYYDYEEYSERVFANAAQGTYYPKYIRSVSRGNNYRLAGQTYAYYVHVEGEWEP